MLDNLLASHQKTRFYCELLIKLEMYARINDIDEEIKREAAYIVDYFSVIDKKFQEIKEQILFPALIEAMMGSDARCIRALIEAQKRVHRHICLIWNALQVDFIGMSNGESNVPPLEKIHQFRSLYDDLIRLEEKELFPLASRVLSDSDLNQLNQAKIKEQ